MLFFKGMVLGFSIAAPVGPIGLLCIRRTLQSGFAAGVCSGLGTAVADALYAAIAVFGISAVSHFLVTMQSPIRLVGGIFLLVLAWKIYHSPATMQENKPSSLSSANYFLTTFLLTITNPGTIVLFAAVFLGLGFSTGQSTSDAAIIVAGVFVGSMSWWLLLSAGINFFRPQAIIDNAQWLNRIAAMLLTVCAIWALGGVVGSL